MYTQPRIKKKKVLHKKDGKVCSILLTFTPPPVWHRAVQIGGNLPIFSSSSKEEWNLCSELGLSGGCLREWFLFHLPWSTDGNGSIDLSPGWRPLKTEARAIAPLEP